MSKNKSNSKLTLMVILLLCFVIAASILGNFLFRKYQEKKYIMNGEYTLIGPLAEEFQITGTLEINKQTFLLTLSSDSENPVKGDVIINEENITLVINEEKLFGTFNKENKTISFPKAGMIFQKN